MYKTINEYEFIKCFDNIDRSENFSYEGRQALFEYLENLEDDIETQIEFDPIAICCEYTEYKNLEELQNNYSGIESMQDLEDKTTVILIPNTERFIIRDF